MIDLMSILDEKLLSVPITKEAVSHEELMAADYIQLSWKSEKSDILPVGTYIIHKNEKYTLMKDYAPTMVNEIEFKYTPQFQSRIMRWQRTMLPVYTYDEENSRMVRELDWTYTGAPDGVMSMVSRAIYEETGESWDYTIDAEVPASITISSQSSSIWSVLSELAELCDTEWYADKGANTIYLKKCEVGAIMELKVGEHVQVPSVTSNNEEFFTRFYAFGSSRNISQAGNAAVVGSIVNKRLTLNPINYPDGYIDTKGHFEGGRFVSDLLPDEVYATALYFDDIYPSSPLRISNVRKRLRYHHDEDGNKVRTGGTDEAPIYSQYAIWYFQIPEFQFTEDLIIEGQTLSVHFSSGQLNGREFELAYHKEAKNVRDEWDVAEEFSVLAREYEIIFDEQTEGFIIPSIDYLIPENENEIILFNINLPQEYTDSAMSELATEVYKEIERRARDNSAYEFKSNPIFFDKKDIDMGLGQRVRLIKNEKDSLDTRVMMVEKQLDFPCEQKIRVGNEIIVGSRQQLRDEVRNVTAQVNKMRGQGTNITFIQRDHTRDLMRTMGRYFAIQDTLEMLEKAIKGFSNPIDPITIRTMALLVGDESLQFVFTESRDNLDTIKCPLVYDEYEKQIHARACSLIHLTLGINDITAKDVRDASEYKSWDMEAWDSQIFDVPEKAYYIYAQVPMSGGLGSYMAVPEDAANLPEMEDNETKRYNFLVGVLNSEYAGTREFIPLYGYTAVLPGQITTDLIRSTDGSCYFDLANNEIGGAIKFTSGSYGDLFLSQNLLRNSGFTGDYVSEPLADETVMNAAKMLFSDPFAHWTTNGILTIFDSSDAKSGKALSMLSGSSISQNVYTQITAKDRYTLSFKAAALNSGAPTSIRMYCGGVEKTIEVTNELTRHVVRFEAFEDSDLFSLAAMGGVDNGEDEYGTLARVKICDLQLQSGTIATEWSPCYLDNISDRTYYQSLKYLEHALNEGSTTINGGLVLTNHIKVGNYANKVMIEETGGMQGTWMSKVDPYLWGGGSLEKAITTVNKYNGNPRLQPTEEELKEMANFVVTHGGRAIMNDAIVRGTIYAQNGEFGGRLNLRFQEIRGKHTLTHDDSSSIILYPSEVGTALYLPDLDKNFDGMLLNVVSIKIMKQDVPLVVEGRILCPQRSEKDSYRASEIRFFGALQLVYSPVEGWILLNEQASQIEYIDYDEDTEYA